jgi:hypothetical protein
MGPAGEAVAPLVAGAAANAVVHVVADVAGGTTAAVAGEAALSTVAGQGSGMLQAWFHRLHTVFTQRRVDWLTNLIREELLGNLPEQMQAAANLPSSSEYQDVTNAVNQLSELLEQVTETSESVHGANADLMISDVNSDSVTDRISLEDNAEPLRSQRNATQESTES